MLRLVTFGGLALSQRDGAGGNPLRVRPQRLAILAVLAAAGDRGVSRERMCALFWPETEEARARHALRQALYALRQEVDVEVLRTEPVLAIDPALFSSDVTDFKASIGAADWKRAVDLASSPFLDGFFLGGAPGFERWVEEERSSLQADTTRALLALARDATSAGSLEAAAEWWRRLTLLDPLSGRFALGYLKALASQGDRAGALAFARSHESVVRRELEADADPDIRRLEADLRALPSPSITRQAPPAPRPEPSPPASRVPDGSTSPAEALTPISRTPGRWRSPAVIGLSVVAAVALAANLWGRVSTDRSDRLTPTFAVGMIREDGIPDTLRIGGVLTDMLATNLARVAGLPVIATSRLYELMLPGHDTLLASYSDAARRAGANEILQGRLLSGPQWGLAIELQRVDLASGMVKGAYRVAAVDRYALIDSMTAAIARDMRLQSPKGSVAEATTDSPIAYRLYEEGLRAYYMFDFDAARRLMESALQEDSMFAMAAYYDALLASPNGDEITTRARALRLAARAPLRERLQITASMFALNMEPSAVAVAESLSTLFPDDPRAHALLAEARWFRGDWPGVVASIERAIALDSASELAEGRNCRLCEDYQRLAETYFWWDSLPAVERTARRFERTRPKKHSPWEILSRLAATRGDSTAMREHYRRFYATNPLGVSAAYLLRQYTLLEDYDQVEKEAQQLLRSPRQEESDEGWWIWSIALRNQGRLKEALALAQQQRARDPARLLEALVALDAGDNRNLVAIFERSSREDAFPWPPAVRARYITWNKTRYGMALVAAGDTDRLRRLIDTVEVWGARSLYGRDRRAHHYLRGMLLVARKQDADAADELRQAIHSETNGFTRINWELGRVLLRLDRAGEAVPVLRAALHGGVDGSNLYVTRTELHELLAKAFDKLGNRDSAAVHYAAVVRAWSRSDPEFKARRSFAEAWMEANEPALTTAPRRPDARRRESPN